MGLFWTEGFESPVYTTKINANGSLVWAAGARSSASSRTGTFKNTSGYTVRLVGGDQDDLIIVGAAFQVPGGVAGNWVLFGLYGDTLATTHLTVTIDRLGSGNPATIKVYRGDPSAGGTLLATSAAFTEPPANTWMHFEVKARLHDSTGSVVVRHDEVTIINVTGVDTKNGGTATVFDGIQVSANYAAGIDDIYMANEQGSVNTDFQGAKRVETLQPTGNGNSSQGVGSDGNSTDNYALIDDGVFTVSTGDYVDLATTGDKDTYVHSDSAQPIGNAVAGVMVWAHAQKTDAGSRSLIPVVRLSGTESDGAALALLNGTFKTVGDVFQTKPGGGAWSVTDVGNTEYGYKAGA